MLSSLTRLLLVKVVIAGHNALHSSLSFGLELSTLVFLEVVVINVLEAVHGLKLLFSLGETNDEFGILLILEASPVVFLNGIFGVKIDIGASSSSCTSSLLCFLLGVLLLSRRIFSIDGVVEFVYGIG